MRFIFDTRDDLELGTLNNEANQLADHWKTRADFIFKQLKDLEKESSKTKKEFWKKIEANLEAKGLLKDYDPEKHYLEINRESQQIFQMNKSDRKSDGLSGLLASLVERM